MEFVIYTDLLRVTSLDVSEDISRIAV